jgi:pilus assembly protein CpaE
MTQKLSVGILASSPGILDSIAARVEETQMASVKLTVDQYCRTEEDPPAQQFAAARPEIIFVDMQDQTAACGALATLRKLLPDTRLYAHGVPNDPQLIIATMQAGAREFLAKPLSTPCVALAFGRYCDEKHRLCRDMKYGGKIYSVISAKGGSGATSVAINMAATLAGIPEAHVAILDFSVHTGDAASYLNLRPRFFLSDAIASASKLDSILLQTFMTKAGKLSLLAGRQSQMAPASDSALTKVLQVASSTYTHTIIDLPSTMDEKVVQVASNASEAVLLVLTPEVPAVLHADMVLAFLKSCNCQRVRLILNRSDIRNQTAEREITRVLNQEIYWRLPNNYEAVIQAINKGVPLVEQYRSNIAASYRRLAENLTGAVFPNARHFFSKLFFRVPFKLNVGDSPAS